MDQANIVISEPGTFLGKTSRRLVIKHLDEPEQQLSLLKIKEITVLGRGITLSSDLIATAVKEQVQINLLDTSGRVVANILSPYQTESIRAARAQLEAVGNSKGSQLAQAMILAKINNQIALLENTRPLTAGTDNLPAQRIDRYIARMRNQANYLASPTDGIANGRLLATEGLASNCYWLAMRSKLGSRRFPGRRKRGATDLVNSLFNYGYAILQSKILSATVRAGLLPFAGFVHQDRPGKPSFVLDAMELFRQPIVDMAIISLLEGSQPKLNTDGRLDRETIQKLAAAISANFDRKVTYIDGKQHRLQEIVVLQLQLIASFLKGDRELVIWSLRTNTNDITSDL